MKKRNQRIPVADRPVREQEKKKKKKMIVLVIIEVLALLVIAAGAFAYFYVQNQYDKIETVAFQKHEVATNPDLPSSVVETSKGYRTYYVLRRGCPQQQRSDEERELGFVIICSINNDTKEIKLVSVLRDTMVQTTDGNVPQADGRLCCLWCAGST